MLHLHCYWDATTCMCAVIPRGREKDGDSGFFVAFLLSPEDIKIVAESCLPTRTVLSIEKGASLEDAS